MSFPSSASCSVHSMLSPPDHIMLASPEATTLTHRYDKLRETNLAASVDMDGWFAGILPLIQSPDNMLPLNQSIILPSFWSRMMSDPTIVAHRYDHDFMIQYQQQRVYASDLEVKGSDIYSGSGLFALRSLPTKFRMDMWGVLGKATNVPLSKYQPERNIELHLNKPHGCYWFVFHPACFSGFMNDSDKRLGLPNCRMRVNGTALKTHKRIRWGSDLYFETIREIVAGEQLLMDYDFCK